MASVLQQDLIRQKSGALDSAPDVTATGLLAEDQGHRDDLLTVFEDKTDVESVGAQKSELAHRTGLLHQTAYVWLFDSSGRLLLERHTQDHPLWPDRWDTLHVHVLAGESVEAAIRRGLAACFHLGGEDPALMSELPVLVGPLNAPHEHKLVVGGTFVEHELTVSYKMVGVDRALGLAGDAPAGDAASWGGAAAAHERARESVFLPLSEVAGLMQATPSQRSPVIFTARMLLISLLTAWSDIY